MQPFGFIWETLPPYPSRQQGASKSSLLIIDRVCWSSSVKWIWILMGAPPFFFNLVFEWIAVSPWAEFPHLKEKVNDTNFLRVNETNKWVWEPGLFCLLPPICTPTPHQVPKRLNRTFLAFCYPLEFSQWEAVAENTPAHGEREASLSTPDACAWFWPMATLLSPHSSPSSPWWWLMSLGSSQTTKAGARVAGREIRLLMLLVPGCLKIHCYSSWSYLDHNK